jgi:hypothetical protein
MLPISVVYAFDFTYPYLASNTATLWQNSQLPGLPVY